MGGGQEKLMPVKMRVLPLAQELLKQWFADAIC
jgi:hypothetical protein